MTVETNLKEFFTAYLVEMGEYLVAANTQLLALEASLRAGGANPRAVRETFRALHTMKGLSAMVGVEPIVGVAHRLEEFLRDYDKRGTKPPLASIDVLLRGVRTIELCIEELGSGSEPHPIPDNLFRDLEAIEPSGQSLEAPPPALSLAPDLVRKLAPFELAQLTQAEQSGQRALRADFCPSPERAAAGLSIATVRERVAKVAEIVKILPLSVPVSPDAPGGLAFALLLVTSESDAAIADAIGVPATTLSALCTPSADAGAALDVPLPAEDRQEPVRDGGAPQRSSLRVDVARLDDVMERLSALIVTRFRMARAVATLEAAGANTAEVTAILGETARQLRDLRAAVVGVRMVPVADLLERVPLLVRGLRRQTNRQVRLELVNGNAELDKSVSERLFPAIVHLVRNAVDHAIETPDERLRRGKPQEGLLRIVCASRSNNRLDVSVEDDGRGIDAEAVARRAGRP
ncbi:MAG TPA: Hpt domain-containing protein, partial [Polyangiaceae bacterium]|nr:Hpt domain-containing protein [Polyangiaceae bacterium]